MSSVTDADALLVQWIEENDRIQIAYRRRSMIHDVMTGCLDSCPSMDYKGQVIRLRAFNTADNDQHVKWVAQIVFEADNPLRVYIPEIAKFAKSDVKMRVESPQEGRISFGDYTVESRSVVWWQVQLTHEVACDEIALKAKFAVGRTLAYSIGYKLINHMIDLQWLHMLKTIARSIA